MNRSINPDKMRAFQLERGLTQQGLAEIAGLSLRTVQRIGCGGRARAETFMRLTKALQVSLDELCDHERPVSPSSRQVGGHVIMVGSTKGGTGRTALSVLLARVLQKETHSVCLLDFHRGRGATSDLVWAQALRQPVPTHVLEEEPRDAVRRLAGLRLAFDYVVIDTSAYEETELIPLAMMADRVLLTTSHPRYDFSITHRVKMWLNAAALLHDKISVVQTLASRYESHRRDDGAFLQTIGLPVCKTVLQHRSAHVYASARGKIVLDDDPKGLAAAEVRQLCHELGLVHYLPSPAARDRRRTKEDFVYLRASWRFSGLSSLAR